MRPAVFLDRDDTLIENASVTANTPTPGDLFDPAMVRLMPGAAEACRDLNEAGLALIVITNQGGVARGHCTPEQVDATNRRVGEALREAIGIELDGVYYCPYHPRGVVPDYTREHPDRKPAPGMILRARDDLGLDLEQSWLVGDATRDVEAGRAAGLAPDRTLLIGNHAAADAPDLRGASDRILRTLQHSRATPPQ